MRLAVSKLYCRPLKGAQGFETEFLLFGRWGPEWDRVFLIVDETGEFVTQRRGEGRGIAIKQMCFIQASFDAAWTHLRLQAPDMLPLNLSLYPRGGPDISVRIWSHETTARGMGRLADAWVTEYLSRHRPGEYRLVRLAEPRPTNRGSALTSFTDGYQVLVVHEASLADLNRRIARRQAAEGEPILVVGWDRIRPTLVLKGGLPGRQAYIEDRLRLIRAGQVELTGETPCPRCAFTQIDQTTATSGKEPMRTLQTYRTGLHPDKPKIPCFGRNFNALGGGAIRVGDRVVIRERP